MLPMGEGKAAHSRVPAWRILWTEEPGGLVHGVVKSWTRLKGLPTHAPILMCVHCSLCFSEYLEFSQFKKSTTLKTILSEGSCHNMHHHDNKFNSQTCSSS